MLTPEDPALPVLWRVAEDPLLLVAPQFVSPAELANLQALLGDRPGMAPMSSSTEADDTGYSAELETAGHPLLAAVEDRILKSLCLTNAVPGALRLRRYEAGQGHPPHCDEYVIDGAQLLATALLCVEAPELGGQTVFLDAADGPLQIQHRAGQLVAWRNVTPAGQTLATARHAGLAVELQKRCGGRCATCIPNSATANCADLAGSSR
jgi:hypothetical protein